MPSTKKSFEQARDAWRDHWQRKDSGLTPTQRVLVGRIHGDFNREHFEKTGELKAWRGWESITAVAGPSKASIYRGFREFERRGALVIDHGGRNPKTGWKLGNSYKAIMPPGFNLIPGQVSNRDKSRFQNETRLSDKRLSELKDSREGIIISGNPRGASPSVADLKPSPSFPCDVPRPLPGWRDRLDEPPEMDRQQYAALVRLRRANGACTTTGLSS